MPFVLDPSIALSWCFEDETSAHANHVLERLAADNALVPLIWPLEIANALLTAERRGRLSAADTAQFMELISALPISVDTATEGCTPLVVLNAGRTRGLTGYDTFYLESGLAWLPRTPGSRRPPAKLASRSYRSAS